MLFKKSSRRERNPMSDTPLPRRTKAQTRRLLLLAGVLIADDTVAGAGDHLGRWLAHIRFDQVLGAAKQLQIYLAEQAPGTELEELGPDWLRTHRDDVLTLDTSAFRDIAKPTAYTVFDSEEEFRERLAEHLLTRERVSDAPLLLEASEALQRTLGPRPSLSQHVAQLADLEFDRVRDLESTFVELGTAPFLGDETIRSLMRRTREDSAYGPSGLVEFYEALLTAHGLRMRAGARVEDLYVALTSLFHGLCFHHRVWPESVREEIPWDDDQTRSMISIAAEGILRQFTEPAEDPAEPSA
jgi:hypothetical protein